MSFLKKIFGENKNKKEIKKQIPWISLTSLDQLENISKESHIKLVAIFKHSTRCGISRMALRQFEKQLNIEMSSVSLYYLDLLVYREISNEITSQKKEGTHYEAIIKSFFGGNEFYMLTYETFKDVRLVGAPPSSIGKFMAMCSHSS